jgi:hypothetical protein
MFYTLVMPDAPPIRCARCREWKDVFTVPIRLPAKEPGWQALCRECFVNVLEVQPTPDLGFQHVKHARRSRGW